MLSLCLRLIFLALLCALFFLLLPSYRHWKAQRFLGRAQAALQRSDHVRAWLNGRQVLRLESSNTLAWLVLAETAKQCRLLQELPLRWRLVELEPASAEHRLQLVNAAVRLGDSRAARHVLDYIDRAGDDAPGLQAAAASLAVITGDPASVEEHLSRALRPGSCDPVLAFNLAVARLAGRDPVRQNAARQALETYRRDPVLKVEALRSLLTDALCHQQWTAALAFSADLQLQPGAELSDGLVHLDLLFDLKRPDLDHALGQVQQRASVDPTGVVQLGRWMIRHQRGRETIDWTSRLPIPIRSDPAVQVLKAEARVATGNWAALDRDLRDGHWGMDAEPQRWAFLALAMRAQAEISAAAGNWRRAIRMADGNYQQLRALVERAASWDWGFEAESLLWHMVRQFPREPWAGQVLAQSFYLDGRTLDLRELSAWQVEHDPGDLLAKNNLAFTLLVQRMDLDQAHALAREVFCKQPWVGAFASTYAYSLYLRGEIETGLALLQSFSARERSVPGTAACYGLLLSTSGQPVEAAPYFALAEQAPLLPELCNEMRHCEN